MILRIKVFLQCHPFSIFLQCALVVILIFCCNSFCFGIFLIEIFFTILEGLQVWIINLGLGDTIVFYFLKLFFFNFILHHLSFIFQYLFIF